MESPATVFLVNEDENFCNRIAWTLQSVTLAVETYTSCDELLQSPPSDLTGCFVFDVQLPGMSGFEMRKRLRAKGCHQPFIILSGRGDVSLAVEAMRLGAIDFIEKPCNDQRLLDAVQKGVEQDIIGRRERSERLRLQQRLNTLTDREREVLDCVVHGRVSKQIASELMISPKTVDVHRSRIMKKLAVDSLAQLFHTMNSRLSPLTSVARLSGLS